MSQMQALLSVLHTNDGDELILEQDNAPQFMRRGQAIKLFLRVIPKDRHGHMVHELLTETERAELAESGKLTVPFDAGKPGQFKAHVRGPKGERIRFVKIAAEKVAEEAPAPVQSAQPVFVGAPPVGPQPLSNSKTEPSPELQQLLSYAAEQGASDLHLATGKSRPCAPTGTWSLWACTNRTWTS